MSKGCGTPRGAERRERTTMTEVLDTAQGRAHGAPEVAQEQVVVLDYGGQVNGQK